MRLVLAIPQAYQHGSTKSMRPDPNGTAVALVTIRRRGPVGRTREGVSLMSIADAECEAKGRIGVAGEAVLVYLLPSVRPSLG